MLSSDVYRHPAIVYFAWDIFIDVWVFNEQLATFIYSFFQGSLLVIKVVKFSIIQHLALNLHPVWHFTFEIIVVACSL